MLARPSPILCFDTCDFLDVLRGVQGGTLAHSRSFVRIQNYLDADRLRVVMTYLVKHEWEQNFESVRIESLRDLQTKALQQDLIDEVRLQVGLEALNLPDFEGSKIVDGLLDLTRRVIDRASVLEQDRSCVDRALERLMARKRPSHKNQIKDSIHLEHYLELARQLRLSGFTRPCLFVSANKSDFWAESGPLRAHPDLESDLQTAGLTFIPRLEAAVRQLGI